MLAASACAGTPIEAGPTSDDTTGATEFPPTTSSTVSATTLETSATASGSASMDVTTDDPTTTTAPTGSGTESTGAETSSPETTGDPSEGSSSDDDDDESDSSDDDSRMESSTGEAAGGCLGMPLRDVIATECSENSSNDAELEITNGCEFTIEVYWVDYECGEDSYATVDPGEEWSIASYQTHPWRVRNAATNELLVDIPPLSGDTVIAVQ